MSFPDLYVARILTAIKAAKNSHVTIHVQGSQGASDPNADDYTMGANFRIEAIDGETDAAYAKRFMKTIVYQWAFWHEKKVADDERKAAIQALPPADSNLPAEAVQ